MENILIPTSQLASSLGVKPATVIRSFCVKGHYMGLRPRKMPNKRLLWPKDGLDRLLSGAIENVSIEEVKKKMPRMKSNERLKK